MEMQGTSNDQNNLEKDKVELCTLHYYKAKLRLKFNKYINRTG